METIIFAPLFPSSWKETDALLWTASWWEDAQVEILTVGEYKRCPLLVIMGQLEESYLLESDGGVVFKLDNDDAVVIYNLSRKAGAEAAYHDYCDDDLPNVYPYSVIRRAYAQARKRAHKRAS